MHSRTRRDGSACVPRAVTDYSSDPKPSPPSAGHSLVSIGVPVYNGALFLREALDSLVSQTYTNLEIIISDNASTDQTPQICSEYATTDRRVRYHRNSSNIGLTANFRNAFELSSGDYFLWACADDIRPPDAVAQCVAALQNNPAAVFAHGPVLVKVGQNPEFIRVSNELRGQNGSPGQRIRALTTSLKHNAMTYGLYRRRALALAVFGNHWGQDYLLSLQISMLGPIVYVPAPIIVYRMNNLGSATTPMGADLPLTIHDLKMRNRPKFKAWVVLVLGVYYLSRLRVVPFPDRARGVFAHVGSFTTRYRRRLARDLLRIILAPLTELCERLTRLRQYLKLRRT